MESNSDTQQNEILLDKSIKCIQRLVLDAYYSGFNQAHYSHVHPNIFPPKECESAGLEFLESKKQRILDLFQSGRNVEGTTTHNLQKKDYLHLYINCEGVALVEYGKRLEPVRCFLVGINVKEERVYVLCRDAHGNDWPYVSKIPYDWFTLRLRTLSHMTMDESNEIGVAQSASEKVKALLSKGFDVFGLIGAGLASDITIPFRGE